MKRLHKVLCLAASLVACLAFTSSTAVAQKVFEGSQQGLPPFGSFHGSSFDNVSLQNGNLHIEIPIISVAQRNGRTFTYRYIYDTRTFTIYWLPNENYP